MKSFYFGFVLMGLFFAGCQKKEEDPSPYQNLLVEEEEDVFEWSSPRRGELEEEWGGEEVIIFEKESD